MYFLFAIIRLEERYHSIISIISPNMKLQSVA